MMTVFRNLSARKMKQTNDFRVVLRRWIGVAVVLACAAIAGPVAASTEHVHGVILGLMPQSGEAVIRHDAFGGMPAMTMPFRIAPAARVRELQPGITIDALVDRSTDPWTLRDVTVSTLEPVTAPAAHAAVVPLKLGDVVPDTPLLDQRGRPFRFSQLRGHDVVLAFIYTRCQDPRMCPLVSAKFNALQRTRGSRDLHLVEVTLDPAYDRPPVLARYGSIFGADPAIWTLAVGDAAPTLDFAARFGIVAYPDPSIGIIHSENTVEIDSTGRIQMMLTDTTWQPEQILADVDARHAFAASLFARSTAGMSGFDDLAILVAIFVALAYLAVRVARGISAKRA
jgi:cytochrome oxidase Cu insertion factor (SCO1/SenC/PrrC family)/Cu/Ag efflux protein CusF